MSSPEPFERSGAPSIVTVELGGLLLSVRLESNSILESDPISVCSCELFVAEILWSFGFVSPPNLAFFSALLMRNPLE